MGRSIHNRPSPNWWSVPPARCVGQPTRAEPMERHTSPKILCLAPNSEFVSFLCPFLHIFFCFYFVSSHSFLFQPLKAHHVTRYQRSLNLGASLPEAYFYGFHAQ